MVKKNNKKSYKIVPALKEDIDSIVKLFKKYDFALQKREWYEWKYFDTPYQKALSFKIIQNDKIVGAVALLPRDFYFQGEKVTGIQAVDGLMGTEIRGKGLFNDVMSFLLKNKPEGIDENSFYISFPSRSDSVKAHQNAGWLRLADFRLNTFFMNLNPLKKFQYIKFFIPVLNLFWRFHNFIYLKNLNSIKVEEINTFSNGLNGFFNQNKVFGDRSKEFLYWRTVNNPKDKIKVFLIIENESIVGFISCKILKTNYEIIDMKFKTSAPKYLSAFLFYLKNHKRVDSVDFAILDNHEYLSLMKKCGFIQRAVIGALFVHDIEMTDLSQDKKDWEINYIDSDW